jgi:two-component system NtrC family sensor kinase
MIAIGNLAGGVAHEINNPIGGILAFSQLMKRDEGRSKADLEALDLIEESALRCKRIVESLLKFSRRSRVEDRRPFDLSRCVEDAARLFIAQLKNYPKAKLEVKPHASPLEVYGDPAQLGQVVLNLLQNGLQALPDHEGELIVETAMTPSGDCVLRVSDTGCGIPERNLSRIFEPHFTTKPPGEGTGLGLSIAYRIVEDHGGRFSVTSSPGRGSSFEVQIPVRMDGGNT